MAACNSGALLDIKIVFIMPEESMKLAIVMCVYWRIIVSAA